MPLALQWVGEKEQKQETSKAGHIGMQKKFFILQVYMISALRRYVFIEFKRAVRLMFHMSILMDRPVTGPSRRHMTFGGEFVIDRPVQLSLNHYTAHFPWFFP